MVRCPPGIAMLAIAYELNSPSSAVLLPRRGLLAEPLSNVLDFDPAEKARKATFGKIGSMIRDLDGVSH